ncbi:hypothetical protein L0B70_07900 [Kaistella sp. 97-N-M2]|uniref:hypothetical protein n=1 Tax=Kaistella sp. 97-N-M2 TaxID=2908645 RepID=UPI001F276265|nr:hypothetical protein [Kaistella sp. 97-N-M2]UJF28791.1 hypothetical protein L0B70_07900 [Kaistella sp. 97-N-M2]
MMKNEPKMQTIFFQFFCLETKEPKVQDLDLFTKKIKFLLRKFPKLGRKEDGFMCTKIFAATQTVEIFRWFQIREIG